MGNRIGNKFGWHSGVLTAKDGKFRGDLYVQDDIVFSDVSAGTLGVTGGIDMTRTTSAIGINMTGGTFSDSAIKITGVNGQGIYINKTASNGPTVKAHCHQLAAVTTDAIANEFKGEFLSIVGTMDGIGSHFHMAASGTGILRSVLGVAYLDAGITLSGTDYTTGSWLVGGCFVADVGGPVNGTGVVIAGLYGGIGACAMSGWTAMNECKYMTAIWGDSTRLRAVTTGDTSLLLLTNMTGCQTVKYGIQMVAGGAITTAINISGNSGATLNAATAVGGYGLKIHTHLNINNSGGTSPNDVTYTNEFKGEYVSTSGVMVGTGAIYQLRGTGTGSMTSVVGDSTLYTGITLSGSAYPNIGTLTGGQFTANVNGTLSGTGVLVTGLYGGIGNNTGSTLTTAAYMSAIWGDYKSNVELGTGVSSILLLTHNGTAVVDYGINLSSPAGGTITTGISISGSTTNGISLEGAVTRGIDFASGIVGITTDRSKSAISIGKRGSSVFAVTCVNTQACHFDPIQINVDIVGANPNATSTMNMIYQQITHDTTAMSNLRLKGADWTIKAAKNLQDAYIFQGEIDFTANTTVGGEAAGLAISMTTAATSVVTGNVWGAILMTSFTSAVFVSSSLFISHRAGTLTHGIYFEPLGSTTITDLLYLNNAGTVTNFFNATTESGGIGTTRATPNSTATCDGSLKVLIGAKTLYIPLYNAIALT